MSGSSASFSTPAGSLALEEQGLELINDNSKRIVSMRINTSDFGRIKAIARRLKARDSDVLRFVLKIGLAEMATLCHSGSTPQELLALFAQHGPALVRHFELNQARLDRILNAERGDFPIAPDDLELIVLAAQSQRLSAFRLQELTGVAVPSEDVRTALCTYLEGKYTTPGDSGGSDPQF